MNIVIDDASPQIKYGRGDSLNIGWIVEHTPTSKYPDKLTSKYSESTFHATFGEGDYMEFKFNGTGVTIYGSKRTNHGIYGIKVDDGNEERFNGKGQDQFQVTMYEKWGLDEKVEHTIRMTNYPSATPGSIVDLWMDVDHIIITHTIPSTMYTTYIDDSSPLITYDPNWISYGYGTGGYYNLTDHMSSQIDTSMEIKFNGSSIQLFGGINNDHGDYTISLDGRDEEVYSANNWQMRYQVPLYTASGLAETEHKIKLTNRGESPQNVIGFDYAIVNSSIKPPETATGISNTASQTAIAPPSGSTSANAGTVTGNSGVKDNQSTDKESKSNIGAIAGGVAGGIVALAFIAVLAVWFLRRKRRMQNHQQRIDQYYTDNGPHNMSNSGNGNLENDKTDYISYQQGRLNSAMSPISSEGTTTFVQSPTSTDSSNHKRGFSRSTRPPTYGGSSSISNTISSFQSPVSPAVIVNLKSNNNNNNNSTTPNHPFLQNIQSQSNQLQSGSQSRYYTHTQNSESIANSTSYQSSSTSPNNSPRSRNQRFHTNTNTNTNALTRSNLSSPTPSNDIQLQTFSNSNSNSPMSLNSSNQALPNTSAIYYNSPISQHSHLAESASDHSHTRALLSGPGSDSGSYRNGNRNTTYSSNSNSGTGTRSNHVHTYSGPSPPYRPPSHINSSSSPIMINDNRQLANDNIAETLEDNNNRSGQSSGFAWG
ncbi:uncharacterized protein L201_006636 [Kwoniella dendrophila CBS 6074]|uniref:Uncharacterized protein n=1 Tax=Kwoniella dendrophila CBS 6074 TaxID=1295534 RepID=A0AAX4K246_9TREE